MSTRRINDLLNLAHVLHWHSVPTLHKPTVAEHSYRVAVTALEIAQRLNDGISPSSTVIEANVMRWALMHDGPETETGDMPHTAKRLLPDDVWLNTELALCPWYAEEIQRVHPPERAIVKIADLLECWMFIRENGLGQEAAAADLATKLELDEVVLEAKRRFGWGHIQRILREIVDRAGDPSDTRHASVELGVPNSRQTPRPQVPQQ